MDALGRSLAPDPSRPRIRLIALDLDDTLLGDDGEIAPRDRAALARARARGVRVVVATGRTWPSAVPYARQIGDDVPVIATGGAAVYDPEGCILRAWRLGRRVAADVLAWAERRGIAVRVDLEREFLYNRPPETDFWNPGQGPHEMRPMERVDPAIAAGLDCDPLQVVVTGRENARALIRAFGHREGEIRLLGLPDRDEPTVVHVTHPKATKGMALAYLARRLGVPRSATLAVGDGINDLPLLAYAGVAAAAPRAVPAARFLADLEVAEDGGIAGLLEGLGIA